MPVQQFRPYDLIVDIIPGALGLVLLAILVPEPYTEDVYNVSVVVAGIGLLLGGFVAGRLLHAGASRWNPGGSDDESLESLLERGQALAMSEDNEPRHGAEDDEGEPPNDRESPVAHDIDRRVLTAVIDGIQDRMGLDRGERSSSTAIKRYGENILYGKTTLYHRYEMLTTFYRSLYVLLSVVSVVYLSYGIAVVFNRHVFPLSSVFDVGIGARYPFWVFLGAAVAMGFGALIARSRYQTFTSRRNRAFVNDLHLVL